MSSMALVVVDSEAVVARTARCAALRAHLLELCDDTPLFWAYHSDGFSEGSRSAEADVKRLAVRLSAALGTVAANAAAASEKLAAMASAELCDTSGHIATDDDGGSMTAETWAGFARDLQRAAVESQIASLREEITQVEARKCRLLEEEAVAADAALEAIQVGWPNVWSCDPVLRP